MVSAFIFKDNLPFETLSLILFILEEEELHSVLEQ